MKSSNSMILCGSSPAVPMEGVLQMIAAAKLSGLLQAGSKVDGNFRVLFSEGKVAYSGATTDFGIEDVDHVRTIRRLLLADTAWGFEPRKPMVSDGTMFFADVQTLLLEIARRNDEAVAS